MLQLRTVFDRDGVTLRDVSCREPSAHAGPPESVGAHTVVFVRRGCFVRVVKGVEMVCDPTVAYYARPGEEELFAHPHADGDECTAITLEASLATSVCCDTDVLPSRSLPTSPQLDLEHRVLLAQARRGADEYGLVERALSTAARALEAAVPRRAAARRPSTTRTRNAMVSGVREALAADPALSLVDLARELAVSPHHLSRVFHRATGHTISRHRMRLRVRAALERLAQGEDQLARLAADVGFADQSHLCRVIRDETGEIPSSLRTMLGAGVAAVSG
jgi:AraC-like DNA-binding protein